MGILRLLTLLIHLLIPSLNPGILPHLNENKTPTGNVATIEIHYHAPEAGVVLLKWGINDWQPVAEDLRPGVDLDDAGIMSVPMRREDETFIAEIRVPVGSAVQYGFSIKETADGRALDVWDNGTSSQNDSSNVQPILIAIRDAVFDVQSAVSLIVTKTFRYRNPEAGEVELVWGINGWNTVPYAADAADTIVDDDLMRTQMVRNGDVFEASIELPHGSHIDYGFSFVKEGDTGDAERIWDGSHTVTAKDGGVVEIDPHSAPVVEPPDNASVDELPTLNSLFMEHWPLLLVGVIIALGLLIGIKR